MERRQRRHQMEHADGGLRTEPALDPAPDAFLVCGEGGDVLMSQLQPGVPAVAAQVVEHEIEARGEQPPERIVEFRRQSIGMAEDETGTVRVAVSPHDDPGAAGRLDFGRGQRLRYVPHI